jgi:hypothetical protein
MNDIENNPIKLARGQRINAQAASGVEKRPA